MDEDMNGKQLGEFSSAEDDHKLKNMQSLTGGYFLLTRYNARYAY